MDKQNIEDISKTISLNPKQFWNWIASIQNKAQIAPYNVYNLTPVTELSSHYFVFQGNTFERPSSLLCYPTPMLDSISMQRL